MIRLSSATENLSLYQVIPVRCSPGDPILKVDQRFEQDHDRVAECGAFSVIQWLCEQI